MKEFVLNAMTLGGILLSAAGVFVFANSLSGKVFDVGGVRVPNSAELGFLLIIIGLLLFGASFVIAKIFPKKR